MRLYTAWPCSPEDVSVDETETNMNVEGSGYLLVANTYPSDKALYRNGFLHRRVKAYQKHGEHVSVFYLHPPVKKAYTYMHDGVQVHVGASRDLEDHLQKLKYAKILVHFASPDMILPIKKVSPSTPVIVWVHGFEAEAWHRRWFNFIESSSEIRTSIEKKKTYYDGQLDFMRWLYTTNELAITFVHVSKWFKENVVEPDAGCLTQNSHVIPNLVDDSLFAYSPKTPSSRLKVLSIRPYASMKYANDLTVDAILSMSSRPYFEEFEFSLYGEGRLFAHTVEPLRAFTNVKITNRFLTQDEIVKVHGEHGVFLAPTRFDSQGVSMCEAMSSGLVPVSTNVSAIPEFVEHRRNGLLADPEDANGLALWLDRLYFDEGLFESLSRNAAHDIRSQCGEDVAIGRELDLMRMGL